MEFWHKSRVVSMKQTNYRDLAEFGLPLVPSHAPAFSAMARDIEDRPQPFGSWPTGDLSTAAVLLNESGKALVILAFIWRYTTAQGKTRTSSFSNLGSSMQMDVLCGRTAAVQDLGSFILPGSKRLITERGMFGNNLDVLPPDCIGLSGGYVGGGGGFHNGSSEELAKIELSLDMAIFEDGLCAGPDASGLFESLTDDLERQRDTSQTIVAALRNGASEGQIFEILRPLARRTSSSPRGPGEQGKIPSPLLDIFANIAINRLVNAPGSELLQWFEEIAESSPSRLHRPS
jgi:hypothetical protein